MSVGGRPTRRSPAGEWVVTNRGRIRVATRDSGMWPALLSQVMYTLHQTRVLQRTEHSRNGCSGDRTLSWNARNHNRRTALFNNRITPLSTAAPPVGYKPLSVVKLSVHCAKHCTSLLKWCWFVNLSPVPKLCLLRIANEFNNTIRVHLEFFSNIHLSMELSNYTAWDPTPYLGTLAQVRMVLSNTPTRGWD